MHQERLSSLPSYVTFNIEVILLQYLLSSLCVLVSSGLALSWIGKQEKRIQNRFLKKSRICVWLCIRKKLQLNLQKVLRNYSFVFQFALIIFKKVRINKWTSWLLCESYGASIQFHLSKNVEFISFVSIKVFDVYLLTFNVEKNLTLHDHKMDWVGLNLVKVTFPASKKNN